MNTEEKGKFCKNLHFIGIGGAGMAPMAMIMQDKGCNISGSDLDQSKNAEILRLRGIDVRIGPHKAENLPSTSELEVIASSAVKKDNPELIRAFERKLKVYRRGEFLAKIAKSYEKSIAVGGSHGKSTITAMIAYCLRSTGFLPGYMIGAKLKTWKYAGSAGDGKFFVCESDESDGTNALMTANIAVISNVDDDHEWNFSCGADELFANFAKFAEQSDILIYESGVIAEKIFAKQKNKISVSLDEAGNYADRFPGWARFQIFNALVSAKAVSVASGISFESALYTLRNFPGLERRFSKRYESDNLILIEDYAHHPAELSVLMESLLKMRGEREVWIIFQPHRYARLKKYFERFICELRKADKVFVLPVFSAWCPEGELDSEKLAQGLNKAKGESDFAKFAEGSFEELTKNILEELKGKKLILAVVGAGDCDRLVELLCENIKEKELNN